MNNFSFSSLDKRLEDFLLLSRYKSYTQVAKERAQSQSTISRSIQKLEMQLGVTLVNRHTYPVSLTPSGKALKRCLDDCNRTINRTISDIQRNNYIKPTMHMGMIDSVARLLAVPLIQNWHRDVSQFSFSVGSANSLLGKLLSEELDCILVNEKFSEVPDLQRHFIFSEPWFLAIPPLLAQKSNWNWSHLSLCGLPFIHSPKHTGDGRFLESFFSVLQLPLPRRLVTNSNDILVASIEANLGWSLLRPTIVAQTHAEASLKLLPLPHGSEASTKFYLIGRAHEYQQEFDRNCTLLRSLVEKSLFPKLKKIVPTLRLDDLTIGSDTAGIRN